MGGVLGKKIIKKLRREGKQIVYVDESGKQQERQTEQQEVQTEQQEVRPPDETMRMIQLPTTYAQGLRQAQQFRLAIQLSKKEQEERAAQQKMKKKKRNQKSVKKFNSPKP